MKKQLYKILILCSVMVLSCLSLLACGKIENNTGTTNATIVLDKEYSDLSVQAVGLEITEVNSKTYTFKKDNAKSFDVIISSPGYATAYINFMTSELSESVSKNVSLSEETYVAEIKLKNITKVNNDDIGFVDGSGNKLEFEYDEDSGIYKITSDIKLDSVQMVSATYNSPLVNCSYIYGICEVELFVFDKTVESILEINVSGYGWLVIYDVNNNSVFNDHISSNTYISIVEGNYVVTFDNAKVILKKDEFVNGYAKVSVGSSSGVFYTLGEKVYDSLNEDDYGIIINEEFFDIYNGVIDLTLYEGQKLNITKPGNECIGWIYTITKEDIENRILNFDFNELEQKVDDRCVTFVFEFDYDLNMPITIGEYVFSGSESNYKAWNMLASFDEVKIVKVTYYHNGDLIEKQTYIDIDYNYSDYFNLNDTTLYDGSDTKVLKKITLKDDNSEYITGYLNGAYYSGRTYLLLEVGEYIHYTDGKSNGIEGLIQITQDHLDTGVIDIQNMPSVSTQTVKFNLELEDGTEAPSDLHEDLQIYQADGVKNFTSASETFTFEKNLNVEFKFISKYNEFMYGFYFKECANEDYVSALVNGTTEFTIVFYEYEYFKAKLVNRDIYGDTSDYIPDTDESGDGWYMLKGDNIIMLKQNDDNQYQILGSMIYLNLIWDKTEEVEICIEYEYKINFIINNIDLNVYYQFGDTTLTTDGVTGEQYAWLNYSQIKNGIEFKAYFDGFEFVHNISFSSLIDAIENGTAIEIDVISEKPEIIF